MSTLTFDCDNKVTCARGNDEFPHGVVHFKNTQ
jgi:hypothetical protein